MTPRRPGTAALGLLLFCGAWPAGPARAEVRPTGAELFAAARFDEAEARFGAVLEDPSTSSALLAEAHVHLAALREMEGDRAGAERHLLAAVALEPAAELPAGLPLGLGRARAAALAALPEGGLSLSLEAPPCQDPATDATLRAVLRGAPPGLVATVALECGAASALWRGESAAAPELEFTVPVGAGAVGRVVACSAVARAASGAALRRVAHETPLCGAPSSEGGEDPRLDPRAGARATVARGGLGDDRGAAGPAPRPRRSPWLWTGLSLGAAALVAAAVTVGVVFGTRPSDAAVGPIVLEPR